MAFKFLNPEFREAHKPIDVGYRPIPLGGGIRSAVLILLAVGVTYVMGYALQDRAEMRGQAILASHPSEELTPPSADPSEAQAPSQAPSQAEAHYSTP